MRKLELTSKWKRLVLIALILAAAVTALVQSRSAAAGPVLLCGPTRQWSCSLPGCPSCPDVLFIGTVCEKTQFEKETGRVCSPI